jgi:hypothetical protein
MSAVKPIREMTTTARSLLALLQRGVDAMVPTADKRIPTARVIKPMQQRGKPSQTLIDGRQRRGRQDPKTKSRQEPSGMARSKHLN